MGPVRSRPYTMMIHLLVGVGFLVGSFVVRPFLPGSGEQGEERDYQAVCVLQSKNDTETEGKEIFITGQWNKLQYTFHFYYR